MSEELFDKSKDNQIRENGLIMNTDEVVDLLNSQSKLISAYGYEFAKLQMEKNKLKEENRELRQTIKEVIELLLEEVDLFSDKATEHDIIAYKEMNEFDNKDAYYMCISTKKAIKMLQRCLDE